MFKERTNRNWTIKAAAVLSMGVAFEASCTPADIQLVIAGLEAASRLLETDRNDEVSFGDYLIDELND